MLTVVLAAIAVAFFPILSFIAMAHLVQVSLPRAGADVAAFVTTIGWVVGMGAGASVAVSMLHH